MSASRPLTRYRVAWLVLVLVVGVALAVGAWRPGTAPSSARRAAVIEAGLRCPSCDGVSVLDSSAATAVAIRQAVNARIRAGESDAAIDRFLTSRYGTGILLRPPIAGATAWVWVLPPAALFAGAAGIVLVLVRRRPRRAGVTDDDRALVARALAGASSRSGDASW
jgi:cytochrome c-type biogenesis protein CcmH/NrfF